MFINAISTFKMIAVLSNFKKAIAVLSNFKKAIAVLSNFKKAIAPSLIGDLNRIRTSQFFFNPAFDNNL
jgi:hypothetical protein